MAKVAAFTGSVDLAASSLGGAVLGANDDFFADCSGLVNPAPAVFIADEFTERGKWMDGWESRRKRELGHDYCILKLGAPGRLQGFDIDTSFFNGNQPAYASIEATVAPADATFVELQGASWQTALPASRLHPDAHNYFAALGMAPVTHLRLNIFPDGGVARLRAFGRVEPNFSLRECDAEQQEHVPASSVDLAALRNGGLVLGCSDAHFGSDQQLLLPGRSPNMGGGWETRRRRGPGSDWVIVRLAKPGRVQVVEVDTQHFKGNYPDRCRVDGVFAPEASVTDLLQDATWTALTDERKLSADQRHFFSVANGTFTHLRLVIFPDGGVSRFRAWGLPDG